MLQLTLALVAGVSIGGVVLWLTGTGQRARLQQEIALRSAAEATASRIPTLEEDLRQASAQSEQHLAQLRELEGQARAQQQAAEDKLRLMEDAKRSMSEAFSALSAEALRSNNASFLQLANQSLQNFQNQAQGDLDARNKAVETLVQPIRESLTRVDGKLGEIERERQASYAALTEQVRGLVQEHLFAEFRIALDM